MIGCLGPMVGTVVVAVNPPGPSAQMAIAEAAGPCPEDTAFCRERNPPMPTRGDNGLTFKKKYYIILALLIALGWKHASVGFWSAGQRRQA